MILLVLIPNPSLNSVIRLGFHKQLPCELQHSFNLGGGFPFIGAEHTQAHATLVIIGDVGMVDFRLEIKCRWLERVVCGKSKVERKQAALYRKRLMTLGLSGERQATGKREEQGKDSD